MDKVEGLSRPGRRNNNNILVQVIIECMAMWS